MDINLSMFMDMGEPEVPVVPEVPVAPVVAPPPTTHKKSPVRNIQQVLPPEPDPVTPEPPIQEKVVEPVAKAVEPPAVCEQLPPSTFSIGGSVLDELVWNEEFRPKTIDDLLLPATMKRSFTKIVNGTTPFPNMLFYSPHPGAGKTTTAKIIPDLLGLEAHYINISLDRGIDTLRDKILSGASGMTWDGKINVIILDEFDGATVTLQKAMRGFVEEFAHTCRFIITCNNINMIIQPIQSRFELISFSFTETKIRNEMLEKIYDRLVKILKAKNVEYNSEALSKFIVKKYPDIRKMINDLEGHARAYGEIGTEILASPMDNDLCDMILSKNLGKARSFVLSHGYDYNSIYRFLFDNLVGKIPDVKKRGRAIVIIEDFMHRSVTSLDKEITFSACMFELVELW